MHRPSRVSRLAIPAVLLVVLASCNEKVDPKVAEAVKLIVAQQPSSSAQNTVAFATQPAIQLADVDGGAISQSGIPITVAIATGGGTLSGTTTATTDANGRATFTGLAITGTVGVRTLTFTAPPLTAVNSAAIDLTAGPATALEIKTQPSATAQLDVAFTTQPEIQLVDASGNPTGPANVTVTATKASGSGTLGGNTTANTVASGLATFAGLMIGAALGVHTISFSALTLPAVTSGSINVTPGPPAAITITQQPSATITSGVVFAQQPIIQLRDAQGNAIAQSGFAVVASIFSGGGTLNGTTSVNTDANGVATFTNLAITGSDGTRVLRFTSGSFTVNSENLTMGGSGSVAGTITLDGTSTPLAGGFMELLDGSTVVSTATVSGSGTYAIGPVSVKAYSLRYQPPLTHSIGAAEPATKPVTIVDQTTTTVNFSAQPALYSDDFQSYSDVSKITYGDLNNHAPTVGNFGYKSPQIFDYVKATSTGDKSAPYGVGADGVGQFSLPATEGPFNDKAFKYTWAASPQNVPGGLRTPAASGSISNYFVKEEFRTAANTLPVGTTELWLRFTDKLSSNFRVGGGGATGSMMEYKYFFMQIHTDNTGFGFAPIQLELDDLNTNPSANLLLRLKLIDIVGGNQVQRQSVDQNLGASFLGNWHTWVVGVTGIGTANCVVTVYRDGVQFSQVSGSWLVGSTIGGAATQVLFEMGANINNGPDQEQYRWWREIGIYKTRPSLKPLVP